MAWPRGTTSCQAGGERLAHGDAQLRRHQVDAGDRLGDRMLDLEPGVHLQEIELAVRRQQELAGAGVAVADGGRGAHRRLAHARGAVSGVTAVEGASSTTF